MPLTQPVLLEQVAAGDREAFGALVTPHLHALLGFATRVAPSYAAAEDALQDVLAQAFQTLQRKPAVELEQLQLRPWLFKSVVNRLRRVGRQRREAASGLLAHPGGMDDVEATAGRRALIFQLDRELSRLEPQWRAAILLRHQAGYGYEEIARILGRPQGTVKAWVHRGTERVRRALAAEKES